MEAENDYSDLDRKIFRAILFHVLAFGFRLLCGAAVFETEDTLSDGTITPFGDDCAGLDPVPGQFDGSNDA